MSTLTVGTPQFIYLCGSQVLYSRSTRTFVNLAIFLKIVCGSSDRVPIQDHFDLFPLSPSS
jgi:hypothetical protein